MDFYAIMLLIFAAIVSGLYLYYRVTGVNLLKAVILSRPVVSAVASAVDAIQKVWPNDTLNIVHKALTAGADATEIAEKLWLMGQLEREERNAYAKGLAYATLEAAGIVIDDRIIAIVSGIIEATCMLLPHGVEPEMVKEEILEA